MTSIHSQRIAALRSIMARQGIAATIIPRTDPHLSEYISDHWQAVKWLSGFTGSAATLIVTNSQALLRTDSRYFLQAGEQLAGSGIELMKEGLPDTPSIENFLISTLKPGDTVGINGYAFSAAAAAQLDSALHKAGLKLDTAFDPVSEMWTDRPALPEDKIFIHDIKYAGEPATSKIDKVMESVRAQGAEALFMSALDEIAWILNIRSSDVPCNPVATSFLLLQPDERILFTMPEKLTDETVAYLENCGVKTAPYNCAEKYVRNTGKKMHVLISPTQTAAAFRHALGDGAVEGTSPVAMLKAIKNPVQLAGIRKAMERDGAALVRSFMEIERRMASPEPLTELDVAEILTRHRSASPMFFDNSFDTIAGFGPHGAIVHYSATTESSVTITPDNLLLIDSGANYLDGTTDITRTITMGNTTDQQRRDFTLVMKGHIALSTAIFPVGTRGAQLDILARQFLYREGLSYLHGTGHGVGHFLNVHEGPQSIRLNDTLAPMTPGMVTSNEPGLYRAGLHGIRCENLVLTVEKMQSDEFGDFLGFEELTLFPFDLNLFDTSIMTSEEINWVNEYHTEVRRRLLPHLNEEEAAWLTTKTAPLA